MYNYFDYYGSFDLGINFEPLMASFDYLKVEKDFIDLLKKNYEYLTMSEDSKMKVLNLKNQQINNVHNDLFFQVKEKQYLFEIEFPLSNFFQNDLKNKYDELLEKQKFFSMYVYTDGICCFDFTQTGIPLFNSYAFKTQYGFADLINHEETLKMIFNLFRYDEIHDQLITPFEKSFSNQISYENIFYQFIRYIYTQYNQFLITREKTKKIFTEEFEKKLSSFLKMYGNENYNYSEKMIEHEFLFNREKNYTAWHFCNQFISLLNTYFTYDSLINQDNPRPILIKLFEIIQTLFPSNKMSIQESVAEIYKAFDQNQDNIFEEINQYFMLNDTISSIGKHVFLTIKRMQVAMEKTTQILKNKYPKINIRESTFKRFNGALGTFLISNYEICQKGEINEMYKDIKELQGYSILNFYMVEELFDLKKEKNADLSKSGSLNRLGNILFYNLFEDDLLIYEEYKRKNYQKLVLEYFHYLSFNRFLNESFTSNNFSLQQINACINKLEELNLQANTTLDALSEKAELKTSFFIDDTQELFTQTKQMLLLKKSAKLDIIRIKNNHQKIIFNILIGIFSAFGIASSIISITMADLIGKIISFVSILVYLLIIIFGYLKNLDEK